MLPYRQKRLKILVQFILDGWRPLTMATELGAWPEYEEEAWGRGYDTMSGASADVSLYLLLLGRGSNGQGGPEKAHKAGVRCLYYLPHTACYFFFTYLFQK